MHKDILSQKEEAGRKLLAKKGLTLRVVRRDGQNCIVTRDYRMDRVNVEVKMGVIVGVINIG